MPTVALTGATGKFGSAVLGLLGPRLPAGMRVRACTSDPARFDRSTSAVDEVRRADFTDPQSLDAAFEGVDTLLLVSVEADDEVRVRMHEQAVAAAARAGVRRIVYTSFFDVSPDSPSVVARVHRLTEEAIRATRCAHTFLRNGPYVDNIAVSIASAARARRFSHGERRRACPSSRAQTWPSFGHAEEPIAVLKIQFGYPPGGAGELVTPSSVVSMYPRVYAKLSYDPFADITPVSMICDFVHGLAVGPGVPESVKSLADLVAWFKADPNKASIANPGEGSLPHFLTMLLSKAIGVKIEAIPYAGGPPGVRDTLGAQVPAMIATEGQFITYYREGRLRMLATSGAQRSQFSPDVPTFTEQGVRSIQANEWIGMFAPAKTPAAITARISATVKAALSQPELIENFGKYAIRPAPSTPEELGKRLKVDYDYWGPVIKSTRFTPVS